MLKTLEEGTGQTFFLLVTTDPDRLLNTIRSRCINVPLTPVERSAVIDLLKRVTDWEGVDADEEALKIIVENTYGHIRDALNLAQQMSLAGPITYENTRIHLNLHLDEEAASALYKSGEDWEKAIELSEIMCQENSPEVIWAAMRRAVAQAAIYYFTPSREKPSNPVREIVESYGPRLTNAAEWVLGSGGRLIVRTSSDLIVAMAILREKLGANLKITTKKEKKHGPTKEERLKGGFGKKHPQMDTGEIIEHLGLSDVENDDTEQESQDDSE